MMLLYNTHHRRDHHRRTLRVTFVISLVKRGRGSDEPREFLHRKPCLRSPLVLNIERVQYAIRRPSSSISEDADDVEDALDDLIHRHNLSARIRCARSFAVFVEMAAVPRRIFRDAG